MLEKFQEHINTNLPFIKTSRLLLAVSGGLDSMVLAHLCITSGYNIALAHCNFMLRGEESDSDSQFTQDFCNQHGLVCYLNSFDTKQYAFDHKISTQMAARDLRYKWFADLLLTHNYTYLMTAHHLDDDLETFLINFGRGTGLKGLTGIPEVNGTIIRPLLNFSRKRISKYATQNKISWREDASNASDDYMRNHIRHHAIPALSDAHANIYSGFKKTQEHLIQASKLLKVYDKELERKYLYPIDSMNGTPGMAIALDSLEEHPEPNAVLFRLLSSYSFTAWEDIYKLRTAQSGKQVFSKTHRLLKNRNTLELHILEPHTNEEYTFNLETNTISGPFGKLIIDRPEAIAEGTKESILLQSDHISSPLIIRKWQKGDFFYPIGMKGKKKLSKYFKDEKLSLVEKENVWLLYNKDDIIWVIGHRADDRYKVTDVSQKMIRITLVHDTKND